LKNKTFIEQALQADADSLYNYIEEVKYLHQNLPIEKYKVSLVLFFLLELGIIKLVYGRIVAESKQRSRHEFDNKTAIFY
jgi:hypothetical protein